MSIKDKLYLIAEIERRNAEYVRIWQSYTKAGEDLRQSPMR